MRLQLRAELLSRDAGARLLLLQQVHTHFTHMDLSVYQYVHVYVGKNLQRGGLRVLLGVARLWGGGRTSCG